MKLFFYTAPWCVACRTVKQFAVDVCTANNVQLVMVDVSEGEPDINITSLPAFRIGSDVRSGVMNRYELDAWLKSCKA
jgi:thiol-disulfide isomerase/thioredoxin